MLVKGDKIVAKKNIGSTIHEGEICKVVSVEDDTISFAFGEEFMHMGIMTIREYEEYFEKVEEEEIVDMKRRVEEIMIASDWSIQTVFGKCAVVACELPNGFIIVESFGYPDELVYDEEKAVDICLDKITCKICELEEYKMLEEDCFDDECPYNCDNCECLACEDDEEEDECLNTDLDCDDCEDYDCPYNTHNKM